MVTIHSSLNSLTESSLLRRRSFLASLAAIGLAACTPEDTVSSHGNGEGLSQYPVESLNEAEEAGILQLREEEKLARDVYTLLEEKWGLSAFSQIKPSEQKHMDAVAKLINRYDLLDPAQESIGIFENQKISSLFETLMTKGEQSEVDALQVGMTVEDVDIYDIDEILSKNDNQDIQVVFTNLRNGSIKHLQRFYTDLKTLGGTYEPQYISQELFDQLTIGI
ncbi:MAG: DUF2202 domain-containing protein [bacterium]|jgi:hypothetical protein